MKVRTDGLLNAIRGYMDCEIAIAHYLSSRTGNAMCEPFDAPLVYLNPANPCPVCGGGLGHNCSWRCPVNKVFPEHLAITCVAPAGPASVEPGARRCQGHYGRNSGGSGAYDRDGDS